MSLVIDPFEDQWGFRGYVADAGDETIIVYSSGNLLTSKNLRYRIILFLCRLRYKFQDYTSGGN